MNTKEQIELIKRNSNVNREILFSSNIIIQIAAAKRRNVGYTMGEFRAAFRKLSIEAKRIIQVGFAPNFIEFLNNEY